MLLQGKPLSYNNILDAAAATGLARDLRGAACVIVKHANPCGAAEADDMAGAWEAALAGDPVSAFGGVVAVTRAIDAALAERLTSIFLEVVAAPDVLPDALEILARKPNLRVLIDAGLGAPPRPGIELRSAGGAVLRDRCRRRRRRSASVAGRHAALTDATRSAPRLDLAWRVCRHVKSNAIVLVRDGVGGRRRRRADEPRRQRPAGRGQGRRAFAGRRVCLGRLLPVPRRARGLRRGRRHRVRPAGRLATRRARSSPRQTQRARRCC